MGKTRDLFKETEDTKGTLLVKMDTIKDRHIKEITEAERLRSSGKNTQKNYTKKVLMTWITTMVWSLTSSQTSWSVKKVGLKIYY